MAHIDELLLGMLVEHGSDLHMMVGDPVRIRVHGDLIPLDMPPLLPEEIETLMREICTEDEWKTFSETGDLDFAYEIPDSARFRCNYLHNHRGPAAVLRVIPSRIASMEELKLPKVLEKLCNAKDGIVLVTGPTGSGKSTTMAAMIDYINRMQRRKIITIENPIEFVHQNRNSIIVHREIGSHAPDFASAVRNAMRGNPDIILIGEMRDLETIRMALQCATMGILVFSTLHTNSAPKTVDRIIDAFPADEQPQIRIMLAEALEGVVSQLLCRKADGRGQVAVHEILVRNEALPNTIREGQTSSIRTIIDGGRGSGMIGMDDSLEILCEKGDITPYEAYMKSLDKDRFSDYADYADDDEIEEITVSDIRLPMDE